LVSENEALFIAAFEDGSNQVQHDSTVTHSDVDKNAEDSPSKAAFKSAVDKDTEESPSQVRTELNAGVETEHGQTKPDSESVLDSTLGDRENKTIEDGRNEPGMEERQNVEETLASTTEPEIVENANAADKPGVQDSRDIDETPASTTEPEIVENAANKPGLEDSRDIDIEPEIVENAANKPGVQESRDIDETAVSTMKPVEVVVEAEVTADDSSGEEQFVSPAASDVDISPSGAETEDVESKRWSAKVPLLDTEPPALDSDYEEAVLCEMDQESVAVSGAVEEAGSDEPRQSADSHSSPATGITAKPKPM